MNKAKQIELKPDYTYTFDDIVGLLREQKKQIEAETQQKSIIEGITMYAWWKDGVQYVGTTGKTLKEAITEIKRNGGIRV